MPTLLPRERAARGAATRAPRGGERQPPLALRQGPGVAHPEKERSRRWRGPPPPGPGSSPGPRAAPALPRRSAAGRLSPGDAGPEMAAARPVLARAVLQQCLSARLQVRPPENGSEPEWVEVMGSQGSGLGPSPGRQGERVRPAVEGALQADVQSSW